MRTLYSLAIDPDLKVVLNRLKAEKGIAMVHFINAAIREKLERDGHTTPQQR
jgi:hypothetical protein